MSAKESGNDKRKSNLNFINVSVYTVDKNRTWAQAVANAGDQIVFVGSNEGTEYYLESETVVTDLGGKMVLPGFIDAHAHASHAIDFVRNISFYLLDSLGVYEKAIAEFVESHPDAEYYRGSGRADTLFPNLGPTKEILDAIIPDRPIAIMPYAGHSLGMNSMT